MKKIMIVDDEVLMRVGIKAITDWESYGCQIVAEAADGQEALDLMEKYHPDIVLTDLVMAPKDGFWLIEQGRKLYPKTVFIVLSSYNDMDNVKRALKLGAVDYLFKLKITEESLIEMLNEIQPVQEEKPEEHYRKWKNIPEIRENFLKNVIEDTPASRIMVKELRDELDLKVDFGEPFVLLRVSVDDYDLKITGPNAKDANLLRFSILNIIMELMESGECSDGYTYDRDFILAVKADGSAEEVWPRMEAKFRQIKEYINRYIGLSVSGCVSDIFCGEDHVGDAFVQTEKMIKRRIVKGAGSFFTTEDISFKGNVHLRMPFEGLTYEIENVISKDGRELFAYLEKYFGRVLKMEAVSEMEMRKYYMELYHGLNKNAELYHVDLNSFTDDYGNNLYTVVLKGDTSTQIKEGFQTVIRKFIAALNKDGAKHPREDIQKAKLYIRNNLSAELTVSSMSEMLGINSSYFSHVFKKETGSGFVDYVNRARIMKAKELLMKTDYPVYEVARMVGIENPNYFSSLFKKITGQNPKDIREKE